MSKKLTITVDDEVYSGLHSIIGRRRISRFLNDLARPHVLRRELTRPQEFSGAHVQREDGVARRNGGIGIIISCADVQDFMFRIERGRGPDGHAGRTQELRAESALGGGVRGFVDDVGFPELGSGLGVESNNASAEAATFVVRIDGSNLFRRTHGNVDAAAPELR